jgi:replicative DNA helicase
MLNRAVEQEAYRHVPYDIDVEQALLGAILADNRAMERASTVLKPDHFYDPLHQRIFATLSQMIEQGGMIATPLTLHARMKSDPGVIETGGQAYFEALLAAAPAIPNVKDKAAILADLAVRRSLIGIGEDIVNTAYEAPAEGGAKTQIEEAEKALYAVAEASRFGEGALAFHEALTRTVKAAERAAARGLTVSKEVVQRISEFASRHAAAEPDEG